MHAKAPGMCKEESGAANHVSMNIAIARIPEVHNTALYFERAAEAAGHRVTVVSHANSIPAAQSFDLFLVIDPWFGGMQYLPELACPTAVMLIDVHRDLTTRAMFARFCDHVFVAQRDLVSAIAATGHSSVHWLPLGGDPGVHFVPRLPRDIDVGFVGKLGTPGTDRHTLLSCVLTRFSTNEIGLPRTPWEMGEIYSRSKIVLNKSIGGDVNMRVFEALAAGALLVTDRIGNGLEELATEGVHYVGYDTAEEAVSQIERYLGDDEERTRIAQAGQDLLRARHTYGARFAQISRTVGDCRGAMLAPARHVSLRQRRLWRAEWARRCGISVANAAALLAEGLPSAGLLNLAIGIARGTKRAVSGLGKIRS